MSSKYYNLNKKRYLSNQKKGDCLDCNAKIHTKSIRCVVCYHKTRRLKKGHGGKEYNEGDFIKYCDCGCGEKIFYKKYFSWYGIPRYLFGHHPSWNKGLTKETNEAVMRISQKKMGNKFGVGLKVTYKERFCKQCNKPLSRKSLGRGFIFCNKKCSGKGHEKELNPRWKNGSSFEPYDQNWTEKFKRAIRKRDNQICMLCGIHRERLNRALCVHHIDGNRKLSIQQNCISLCISCHIGTVHGNKHSKEHWIKFFQSLLNKNYSYEYTQEGEIKIKIGEQIND